MARTPASPSFPSRRGVLGLIAAGLLVLGGCASMKVHAERYPELELEAAKTYAWITEDLVLIQFGQDQPRVRTKENEELIRAAIDRKHVKHDTKFAGAREVAFFPPMTGG